tara:strand:- start:318 stop:767 length:450 start_codon:yes stop_codon:yes gene_type:complete
MNKREIMIAFKDYPEVIEAYANLWFSKDNCIKCNLPFIRKTHNHKYCSYECKKVKTLPKQKNCPSCSKQFYGKIHHQIYCSIGCRKIFYGTLTKDQHYAFERANKKKFLTELKTVECSFCGSEYKQHKTSRAEFCSDFCRKAARKYKEK